MRSWKKLLRYARIYGWRRAVVKAAGRARRGGAWMMGRKRRRDEPHISVIGCGQAAFATLCYFLYRERGSVFLDAFDVERKTAQSLAGFYGFRSVAESAGALFENPALRTVYIASNHASHAAYAVAALQRGLNVFVEKPIATSWEDLASLEGAALAATGRLWAGYNRPFAPAIRHLRHLLTDRRKPIEISCAVHGHVIPAAHWYRNPDEGTRISGNAGHWLDLGLHLIAVVWGSLPEVVEIELSPDNPAEPDDNFSLSVRTAAGDVISLRMISPYEPPDGVHENIIVECADVHAEIDDFRAIRVTRGGHSEHSVYRPKDVGHRQCTLQPWLPAEEQRNIEEVWRSARLVLHATELARRGGGTARVNLSSTPPASFEGA